MAFLFFIGLFLLLFFLSRRITRLLSHLLTILFRSQTVTIYLLSFLFLPGVVLHELSHLLVANVLFVPTGEVEFFPEIQGKEVKMGSVAIAKTDPLRRFLVGIAPTIGGMAVLLVASGYLVDVLLSWKSVVLFYVVFQIANTMFSSKKDMEGAVGFLVSVVVVGGILQVLGFPVIGWLLAGADSNLIVAIVARINTFLFLAIGLDVFLALLFEGLIRLRKV